MTTRVTQVTHLPHVAIGARIENEQELTSLASLSWSLVVSFGGLQADSAAISSASGAAV